MFWASNENVVLADEKVEFYEESLLDAATRFDLSGNLFLQTSGSYSEPKWAALSKDSMLSSARAVNDLFDITKNDRWISCLPTFHVGGLSIHARASESDTEVVSLAEHWNPKNFIDKCQQDHITLCSLVPAQLFDLVSMGECSPKSLRAIIVGGSHLDETIRKEAISLGWPVHTTYGMTEACSQVATERMPGGGLEMLDFWETRTGQNSELNIKGPALFNGYLTDSAGQWSWIEPFSDSGWYATGDQVEFSGNIVTSIQRLDAQLKILGEKVNLEKLQLRVARLCGNNFTVTAVPDSRSGQVIALVAEQGADADSALIKYNNHSAGIERAQKLITVEGIPRSSLGKLQRKRLRHILENAKHA